MRLLITMCRQDGVYWAPTSPGANGEMGYAAPIAVKIRWEGLTAETRSLYGVEETSKEIVYCYYTAMDKGGWVWLGLLSNLPSTDPHLVPNAREIQRVIIIPTLRATQRLQVATM
jgi:hypothetical protein